MPYFSEVLLKKFTKIVKNQVFSELIGLQQKNIFSKELFYCEEQTGNKNMLFIEQNIENVLYSCGKKK